MEIEENGKVMLARNENLTRLWIAEMSGVFKGKPNLVWQRRLSDDECDLIMENPYRIFDRTTPMIRSSRPVK